MWDSNFYFPVFYRETISAQDTSVYIFPFIQPRHGPKEGIYTIIIFSVFPVILRHNYIQSIFLIIFAIIWHICCWIRGDVKSIYMAIGVDEEGHFRGEMLDPDYTNMMHAAFHPDCSRSLLRNDVRDEKTVCEYYVLSCGCELAMLDLGKALQHSLSFTRCATCGRFFFAFDRRRRYCGNSECNTGRARANKYRKQNQEDPVLEKALCYKNVMASRYRRTIQREKPYTPQKESPRSVSHLEYEQWTRTFHQELNRYKDAKGGAFLLDTEDEDAVIKEAGTFF